MCLFEERTGQGSHAVDDVVDVARLAVDVADEGRHPIARRVMAPELFANELPDQRGLRGLSARRFDRERFVQVFLDADLKPFHDRSLCSYNTSDGARSP